MPASILAAAALLCSGSPPDGPPIVFRLLIAPATVTQFGANGTRHIFQRQAAIENGEAIVASRRAKGEPTSSIDLEGDGTFQQFLFMPSGERFSFSGSCRVTLR